jgi:hypothetical protein
MTAHALLLLKAVQRQVAHPPGSADPVLTAGAAVVAQLQIGQLAGLSAGG